VQLPIIEERVIFPYLIKSLVIEEVLTYYLTYHFMEAVMSKIIWNTYFIWTGDFAFVLWIGC